MPAALYLFEERLSPGGWCDFLTADSQHLFFFLQGDARLDPPAPAWGSANDGDDSLISSLHSKEGPIAVACDGRTHFETGYNGAVFLHWEWRADDLPPEIEQAGLTRRLIKSSSLGLPGTSEHHQVQLLRLDHIALPAGQSSGDIQHRGTGFGLLLAGALQKGDACPSGKEPWDYQQEAIFTYQAAADQPAHLLLASLINPEDQDRHPLTYAPYRTIDMGQDLRKIAPYQTLCQAYIFPE